jgi:fused-like protein
MFGQLGNGNYGNSNTPNFIELENVLITKISCGSTHNLLLSNDGTIYEFGDNDLGKIGRKILPTRLNHEKKFIDIASHFNKGISMAKSVDNVFYIWGEFCKEHFLTPTEISYNSFDEIFTHYFEENFEVNDKIIEFSDLPILNGYYERRYDEINELGEGGYGKVFKAKFKNSEYFAAIKKISLRRVSKNIILREFQVSQIVQNLYDRYAIQHFESWIEKSPNNNEIILFVIMDLCDKTLKEMIEEMKNYFSSKDNKTFTPIGYYIASQLFIDILESVLFLHRNNIIHRDLNPYNIMLKMPENFESFLRIVDFGLIAIHESSDQTHSSNKGNIEYIAPEAMDGRKYDTKADIYSLGILLTEIFDFDINE